MDKPLTSMVVVSASKLVGLAEGSKDGIWIITFSPDMKIEVLSRYCSVLSDAIVTSVVFCSSVLLAIPINSKLYPDR